MSIIDPIDQPQSLSSSGNSGLSDAVPLLALSDSTTPSDDSLKYSPLVAWVKDRFNRSELRRQQDEYRWLDAYRNFRGIYSPDVKFTDTEKSRVFLKITKTKVLAAYSQLVDVLFAGNSFPIGVEAPRVPDGELPDSVSFDPKAPKDTTPPDPSVVVRPELLGPFRKLIEGRVDPSKMKAQPGLTPSSATWEPAKEAARKMQKKILDQIDESDGSTHLRHVAFEMALLGHAVLKGPFSHQIEESFWGQDGTYTPKQKTSPKIEAVSVWNFYPDADALNMQQCSYTVERHKYSRSMLRGLKKRPYFRSEAIDACIKDGPNYVPKFWESVIEDQKNVVSNESFEVLEYWGVIDKEAVEFEAIDIPEKYKDADELQVNMWICGDHVLRLVVNPFTPSRLPYNATPYEINPYSFFGVGVAENMFDTQFLMNGFMRMAVDNAALSGNVLIEIDETNLVPGQDMTVYPGKIFRRQGGAPGQSIFGTKFPNVSNDLLSLYDKARQLTDEATSMPSYAHGDTSVTGVGRTASGMSMLMGAADKSIKSIVRNIDDYILQPLGESMYNFNMQFDFDPELAGNMYVIARGTESLMRNEVRSQKLLQFYQVVSTNPLAAPFAKIDYILRELAVSLDLDEEKIINDPREAIIQASIMAQMQAATGAAPAPGQQPQQPNTGLNDPSGHGGGMVQPGAAPAPGAKGFTGASSGAGNSANGGNPSTTNANTTQG